MITCRLPVPLHILKTPGSPAIPNRFFMGFLHSAQANAGTVPLQSIICNHPSARQYNITNAVEKKTLLNKQESIRMKKVHII
jgi:hypothetical protein